MCKKKLRGLERECGNCRTDVSLLVDYVENLREGLVQAEALTRQGELGEAVWAYLSVLEVDPDNATARKQVGKVATAIRQFDRTAPGRRWAKKLHSKNRIRRWIASWSEDPESSSILGGVLWFLVVFGALMIGYIIGMRTATLPPSGGDSAPGVEQQEKKDPEAGKAPAGEKKDKDKEKDKEKESK
jgi:hypothetical protein